MKTLREIIINVIGLAQGYGMAKKPIPNNYQEGILAEIKKLGVVGYECEHAGMIRNKNPDCDDCSYNGKCKSIFIIPLNKIEKETK